MNIFAIGDLHLSHLSEKPMEIFGSQWFDHMTQIKNNWKQSVLEEDIVLLPGDISWGMRLEEAKEDLSFIAALPGKKVCIRGNHDYWWDRPGKLNQLYPNLYFLQNTAVRIGDIAICGTRGWSLVPDEKHLEQQKKLLEREKMRLKLSLEHALKQNIQEIWVMLHYPPTNEKEKASIFTELIEQYPVTKVIYGHLHDRMSWQNALQGTYGKVTYYLASADYLSFKPIKIGAITKKHIEME